MISLKAGSDAIKLLWDIAKVVLIILVVMFVWDKIFGLKTKEISRVALTSSDESDLVVTSFAQVDLLYLKGNRKELVVPSQETATNMEVVVNDSFANAKSYCLHSYEVVFGYESLAAQRTSSATDAQPPVPEPAIVAINVLRTENAPDDSTRWCQEKNLKSRRGDLRKELRFALEHDEVWRTHITHGQLALAEIIDLGNAGCRKAVQQDTDVAEAGTAVCLKDALAAFWKQQAVERRNQLATLRGEASRQLAKLQLFDPASEDLGRVLLRQADADFQAIDFSPQCVAEFDSLAAAPGEDELRDGNELMAVLTERCRAESSARALQLNLLAQERSVDELTSVSELGADVAALVLTFSATLGVSQERKRFFGLLKSKRFYLQRDVAKVYYGSSLAPSAIRTEEPLLGSDRIIVELREPAIIAMDRYSSFIAARNKIEKRNSKQSLGNYLNQQMLDTLERGIKRFHERAIKTSEAILLNRVPLYFGFDGIEYEVRFTRPEILELDLSFLPGVIDFEESQSAEDEP